MKIRFWGCRGSIPTPDATKLRYGGNTTCVEVRLDDGSLIVIDAGSGIRALGNALMKEGVRELTLLLTHSHWDHLMGFPFFVPAYLPGTRIRLRGGPLAKRSLKGFLEHQMEPPYFPVDMAAMKAELDAIPGTPKRQKVGSADVDPIPLSHPNGGYGFRITEGARSFVFLTDNELGMVHENGLDPSQYVEAAAHADLLVHDTQYTREEYEKKRGWGHSTFEEVVRMASSAKTDRVGFFHHDPDRGDQQMDTLVERAQQKMASERPGIECFGAREGMEIVI